MKPTQEQMYYNTVRDIAEQDRDFLVMTTEGEPMTRSELRKNIAKRPAVWGRYSAWLNVLKD